MTPELAAFDAAARIALKDDFDAGRLNKTGGVYNCRRKKLASRPDDPPYSEHSWGAAKDYYVKDWNTPAGKAVGDRLAAFARAYGCDEVYWQIPLHFNHLHICPKRYNFDGEQVPPCAGGPPTPQPEEVDIVDSITDTSWLAMGQLFPGQDWSYYTSTGDANGATATDAEKENAFNAWLQRTSHTLEEATS